MRINMIKPRERKYYSENEEEYLPESARATLITLTTTTTTTALNEMLFMGEARHISPSPKSSRGGTRKEIFEV